MSGYPDHIEHMQGRELARMERKALALTDPNITHAMYRALARIVGTAQVETIREIACEALISVDFWTPPIDTMNTFSPELDSITQEF